MHTSSKSSLIGSGKLLWLRIAFTIIQLVHIACEIGSDFSSENQALHRINTALLYFNLVNLPFHTILTTSSIRPDVLYLTHLYGNGLIFLLKVMEYAQMNQLGDAFCYVLFGATHFIFHVPTNLLYLKTFEACAEMCWIDSETNQINQVDQNAIFVRLMKPWLFLFAFRLLMALFRSIVGAATNRADYWWGLNAGTLGLQYAFYSMLLLFEIYMYLQLNPKKQGKWYLLVDSNKMEMTYLIFILSLGFLAFACFVLAFFDAPKALLETLKYLGNAILISRWILLWYYAKDEMDCSHQLTENLNELARPSEIMEMKKASTEKKVSDYSDDSDGLYHSVEGIDAKTEGEETITN